MTDPYKHYRSFIEHHLKAERAISVFIVTQLEQGRDLVGIAGPVDANGKVKGLGLDLLSAVMSAPVSHKRRVAAIPLVKTLIAKLKKENEHH